MTRPRILHVTREFSDLALGGIEQSILLAAHDGRYAHQVLALGHKGEQAASNCDGLSVVRVFPQGSVKFFPWSLAWLRVLRELSEQVDIIHLHSPFPLGELSVFHCKKPVICSYHADIVNYGVMGRLYNAIQRVMIRQSAAVIATSTAYAKSSKTLRRLSNPLSIVPFGLPKDSGDPEPPQSRLPPRFFLFIGSKRRYKGLSTLLDAARLSHCSVVIAGGDQAQEACDSYSEHVVWLGGVTDAEKAWLLQKADALILPSTSRAEAFGLVLLEAMRAGRPCISTRLGTGTDWVVVDKQTGLVVEPNRSDQLAEAMRCLYQNPKLREEMGRAGRARFEQEFSLACYHQGLDTVYQRVLV